MSFKYRVDRVDNIHGRPECSLANLDLPEEQSSAEQPLASRPTSAELCWAEADPWSCASPWIDGPLPWGCVAGPHQHQGQPSLPAPASRVAGAMETIEVLLLTGMLLLFVTLNLLLDKNQTMELLDMMRSLTCQFLLLASDNPLVLGGGARLFWRKLNNEILFASAGSGWGFGDCRKTALTWFLRELPPKIFK